MNVLITGGTGFIGLHLITELKKRNYFCRCLVRKTSNVEKLKNLEVELFYGDITDKDSLRGIAQGIDMVYHLAAIGHVSAISKEAYQRFYQINVEGTKNLGEECSKYQLYKFIHFSSTAAMGLIRKPIVDETTECQPSTPYQKSKYESEKAILSYWQDYQLPVVILRPCMVYGDGGGGEFLKMCRLIKKGLFPQIGQGKNLTPMVHVNDVVLSALLAGEKGTPGQTYLIASDSSFELETIRELIAGELGVKKPYIYVPVSLAKCVALGIELFARVFKSTPVVTVRNIESTVFDRVFSIAKAKQELGYQPEINLKDGIRETIRWYRKVGYV